MPTERQIQAVKRIVETGGKSVSKAMREAKLKNGENAYSEKTAKTPSKLTGSKGFKELINKYLPDDLILSSLEEDIKKKPQNRKPELELASKLKGLLTDKLDLTSKGKPIPLLGGDSNKNTKKP